MFGRDRARDARNHETVVFAVTKAPAARRRPDVDDQLRQRRGGSTSNPPIRSVHTTRSPNRLDAVDETVVESLVIALNVVVRRSEHADGDHSPKSEALRFDAEHKLRERVQIWAWAES